jgi:hypothetical protein
VKAIDSVPSPGIPNSSTTSGYEKDRRIPFIIEQIAKESETNYGLIISYLGDFDGDGFNDAVVTNRTAQTNRGIVHIYYADRNKQSLTIVGGSTNSYFGRSIQIGDFNGDGFDDIAIGSYGAYANDGRVYIYTGSSSGIPNNPQSIINEPSVVPTSVIVPSESGKRLGNYFITNKININGDKNNGKDLDDIAVNFGTQFLIFKGRINLPSSFNTSKRDQNNPNGYDISFQTEASATGSLKNTVSSDVDGDGFNDAIFANNGFDVNTPGKIYILFGSDNISGDFQSSSPGVVTITGTSQTFGLINFSADFTNDNAGDLLTVDSSYNIHRYKGIYGSKTMPVYKGTLSNSNYSGFGNNLSSAGDLDLDGMLDLLVSTDSNAILVYRGDSDNILSNSAYTLISGPLGFGVTVSGYGRYNGDKFPDFITINRQEGELFVIK